MTTHHKRTDKPKLLIVTGTLTQGGAERFVSNLVQHLDRTRFKITIAVLRKQITYTLPADIDVVELRKYRPWHLFGAVLRLASWMRKSRPDVVLSAWSFPSFVTALALRIMSDRPFWIARIGSSPAHEEKGVYRALMQWLYRRADRFVANCDGIGDAFVKQYPFSAGKLHVAWNPTPFDVIERAASEQVDDEAFDKPTIVSVGRLAPEKRHDLAIRAFKIVRAQLDARLIILGEGAMHSRLQTQIEEEGLDQDIVLKGFEDNPFKYVARASVYVQASDYEGLSNALIEAQGLGVPTVTTNCPFGPADVIRDGHTGVLVPMNDADALATEIVLLLKDETKRKAIGAAARRRARECFGAATIMKHWTGLILDAAAKQTRRSRENA